MDKQAVEASEKDHRSDSCSLFGGSPSHLHGEHAASAIYLLQKTVTQQAGHPYSLHLPASLDLLKNPSDDMSSTSVRPPRFRVLRLRRKVEIRLPRGVRQATSIYPHGGYSRSRGCPRRPAVSGYEVSAAIPSQGQGRRAAFLLLHTPIFRAGIAISRMCRISECSSLQSPCWSAPNFPVTSVRAIAACLTTRSRYLFFTLRFLRVALRPSK